MNPDDISAQTLYGTCNAILCVLNFLCRCFLFSFINPPYVVFIFDWQVVFILPHTEDFFSPVNLFSTTRLSRGFCFTTKEAITHKDHGFLIFCFAEFRILHLEAFAEFRILLFHGLKRAYFTRFIFFLTAFFDGLKSASDHRQLLHIVPFELHRGMNISLQCEFRAGVPENFGE